MLRPYLPGCRRAAAAHRAGIGLRMKAAVRRVLVFLAAAGAEHKIPHACMGPVIGYVDHDGVARAAIGAVGEGIFEAAILWIEKLLPAVAAGGKVRQNVDGLARVVVAGANLEMRRSLSDEPRGFTHTHDGGPGPFLLQPLLKAVELFGRSFDFHDQPGGRIQYPSGEGHFGGKAVDKRTKADALNGSAQRDPQPLHRGFCRHRHKRRRETLTLILGFYGLAESAGNDLDESRDWTSPSIRDTSAGMAAASTGEKASPCSKQSAVRVSGMRAGWRRRVD